MNDDTRPLALWGFLSSNLFSGEITPDYYLSLVAFFEPFIEEKDGQLLDIDALKEYAASKLNLLLTDDVVEIFTSKMSEIGWLVEIARKDGKPLYKCKFIGVKINHEDYTQYDARLTHLIDGFAGYIAQNNVELASSDRSYIEESFMSFLVKQFISDGNNFFYSSIKDDTQIEYWIAKYISYINLRDSSSFEFVQQISGVLLLADGVIEIGNPSQDTKQLSDLVVFLDGPLVMNYLGLAGKREKDNVAIVIDRLKKAGAKLVCFKHSCDEIRDNLSGLFRRAPHERTGPSAEAIRKGEVPEILLANVRNNVEHFVEKVAKLEIVHAQLNQYEYAARYCDDALYHRLMLDMPSESPTARERDAASIAIIMRRRGGHETSELRDAKSSWSPSTKSWSAVPARYCGIIRH